MAAICHILFRKGWTIANLARRFGVRRRSMVRVLQGRSYNRVLSGFTISVSVVAKAKPAPIVFVEPAPGDPLITDADIDNVVQLSDRIRKNLGLN